MNTAYNEIVNVPSIGAKDNPIALNEILKKANDERLAPGERQCRACIIPWN